MANPRKTLTARDAENAKAGAGERLELWDSEVKGLCLRVSETAKVWVYRYRRPDGSQPRHKLGAYVSADKAAEMERLGQTGGALPLTVANARTVARRLRVEIDGGGDPAGQKRRAAAEAKAQTVRTMGDLADTYFAACESGEYRPRRKVKRASTLAGERGLWERHAKPTLARLGVEDVSRSIIRSLLRKIVTGGAPIQANRVRSLLRQMFNFAIAEERLTLNPVAGLAPAVEETPRMRVLTDAEIAATWQALQAPEHLQDPATGDRLYVGKAVALALQLVALTLQRRTQVAEMRLSELNLAERVWILPPERTKGGKRPHLVPLAPKAVALIEEAIALAADGQDPSPFVFPSPRDRQKPITGGALTHALRDIYRAAGVTGASLHDLRRTGSTVLTSERLGFSPFARSLVLGHMNDPGGGAAVSRIHYDANTYVAEKRRAIEGWANLLAEIVGEAPLQDNVVRITG